MNNLHTFIQNELALDLTVVIRLFSVFWCRLSKSVTFSELTRSQWKALVHGFVKFALALKSKGGGGGALGGGGPVTADEPDSWEGGSGTVEGDIEAVWGGGIGGRVGDDEATTSGEVGNGTGGKTSLPVTPAAAFPLLRGLG